MSSENVEKPNPYYIVVISPVTHCATEYDDITTDLFDASISIRVGSADLEALVSSFPDDIYRKSIRPDDGSSKQNSQWKPIT